MPKRGKRYEGHLDWWCETGSEGTVWIFYEKGKTGWDGVHFLKAGDHLTIYAKNRKVIFSDVIKPDRKAGWAEYPLNPGHGQPAALGLWIHWTQSGWKPDDWAKLFLWGQSYKSKKPPKKVTPLRAVLIRNKKSR